MKEFTEQGWINGTEGATGASLRDLEVLQNTDAFLFAGLGTPTATDDPSTQLQQAFTRQMGLVGAYLTPPTTVQATGPIADLTATLEPDATVIVLHYDPANPGGFADRSLLNDAQPEDKFAEQLLLSTQNAGQKLVDVLVTGPVAPTKAVQETLIATKTQTPNKLITLTPEPPGANK